MTGIVNSEQYEVWNGSEGRHWAEHHRRYDAMAADFTDLLLDAAEIGPDDRVLDIGCGTGQTTRAAARRAHRAHTVGIDLSAPMLDRARAESAAENVDNATFEQGDAQVHPFRPDGFDAAISRAGVMFFADAVAAFGNIRRALRPGGRLAFVCHRRPGRDVEAIIAALHRHLPPAALSGYASVADFADPEHIRTVLTAAGFAEPTVTGIEVDSILGTHPAEAAEFLLTAQLGSLVRDMDPAATDAARRAVETALQAHENDGAVCIRARGWLVTTITPPAGPTRVR